MLEQLLQPEIWKKYYEHKIEKGHLTEPDREELREFIEKEQYRDTVEKILQGGGFSNPRKICLSKMHTSKKRIVYTYETAENHVLKVLTYLLHRKYDTIFAPNLYSFRPGIGVKNAVYTLTHTKNIAGKWSYKADISNYFNSIPVGRMLERLKMVLKEDEDVFCFIALLLQNPKVQTEGKIIEEEKGIMAGTAISTFLANVYLASLDHYFRDKGTLYARYSDDIILFADTKEELEENIAHLQQILSASGLVMNPAKECITGPGKMWTFLGISYHNGVVDVAPVSVEKLKAKMRRKTRALMRWKARKGATGEQAAKAFIRVFREKLFENPAQHELTWARWYFPLINTAESLKMLDQYSESCVRYLVTGKHTKAAYNCRYEDIKRLGFVSLVNQYYKKEKAVW